jgi:hypothetical protein
MNCCHETTKMGVPARHGERSGEAGGQPQVIGSEAYLDGTSQGPMFENARKDGHMPGRSKRFMKHPG